MQTEQPEGRKGRAEREQMPTTEEKRVIVNARMKWKGGQRWTK